MLKYMSIIAVGKLLSRREIKIWTCNETKLSFIQHAVHENMRQHIDIRSTEKLRLMPRGVQSQPHGLEYRLLGSG